MRSSISYAAIGFTAATSAASLTGRADDCCFSLSARGKANGILGQLSDGQNRVGGGHSVGTYCLKDGGFYDKYGRGCILTPPTTQFQCDEGATPTRGFAVDCNGAVSWKGSNVFYACPVNDNNEWNTYQQPAPGQAKCGTITITATGACSSSCKPVPTPPALPIKPGCPSPPCVPPPPKKPGCLSPPCVPPPPKKPECKTPSCKPAPPPSPPTPPKKTECKGSECECKGNNCKCEGSKCKPASCPADLQGPFEFPHLIVPVDSNKPTRQFGNTLNGAVAPSICTAFNFDVRDSFSGKTCTAVFLFPKKEALETSSFVLYGKGGFKFAELSRPVTDTTSWKSLPEAKSWKVFDKVFPGTSYSIYNGPCPAGKRISFLMCSTDGLAFEYFQDFNPSPIGLYVRAC